jgi:hypothetical protein
MNYNKMSANKDKVVIVAGSSTGIGYEISASGEYESNSIPAVSTQKGSSVSVIGDTYRIIIDSDTTSSAYTLVNILSKWRSAASFSCQLP